MIPPHTCQREAALKHWRGFLPRLLRYGKERNRVEAGHANVSRLSAALRTRLVLDEEILSDTMETYGVSAVPKWLKEVCWRRYWKSWLELRPQIWRHYRESLKSIRQSMSHELAQQVAALEEGRGPVAVMNHFAQELTRTGYLHNHARMWFASYWIHVERLPWELGADFFFRHLLDADPASNTLSWRWVAGLHTPGKTYLVRRSNLEQNGPAGWLAPFSTGLHLLEDDRVAPHLVVEEPEANALTAMHLLLDLPIRLPELPPRWGLWFHPDDLLPEKGPFADTAPVAIAGFSTPPAWSHYGLSVQRLQHLHACLEDTARRASHHFGVAAQLERAGNLAVGLVRWAQEHHLSAVVAYAPFCGPLHDAISSIRQGLHQRGITLHLLRRPGDLAWLPLGTRGFFPFWEKQQGLLGKPKDPQSFICD